MIVADRDAKTANDPDPARRLTELVADDVVDTVTVAVVDGFGRPMGKRMTRDYFLKSVRTGPVAMSEALFATDIRLDDIEGILGASGQVRFGDFLALPDPSTTCRLAAAPNEVLVLCDSLKAPGVPFELAARQILRGQIAAAADVGLRFRMASELEFYLLSTDEPMPPTAAGRRARQLCGQRQDYHLLETAPDEPLLADLVRQIEALGIGVEYRKGESGVGQHEIVLAHDDTLAAADRHILFKYAVKRIASAAGRTATFLAKLSDAEDGSSGHIHLSLWSIDGEPLGGTAADDAGLSGAMRSFVAGILAFIPELMPFCAPLPNSYKRYRPGVFAPYDLWWGFDDRHAAVRLLGEGPALRLEFRVPGADMNPYLAYSALIAAGLEGIRRDLPLPDQRHRDRALRLPSTLAEAVRAFEASPFARASFGEEVVRYHARLFGREADLFTSAVSDWERARYYREA